MTQISHLVESLSESQTLAMSQRSSELRSQGVDVINLSVGEPDFATPDHIKQAAKTAIDQDFTHYPPVPGYMSLRQAIADRILAEDSIHVSPTQIVVGNGAKQALCNVILSTVGPGDEVIIPTPAWVSYVEMVKLAQATTIEVPAAMDQGFKITPAQLKAAITPRTRMLLICSPSNPSGAVYSQAELEALVDVLAAHPQILVVSDEIYRHINYTSSYTSMLSFSQLQDRVVVISGVSKAYAMTGWRIGHAVCPQHIAKAVTKLQGQYTSAASSIAQKAAEAAYCGPQECVYQMCEAFRNRRDLVVSLAKSIPGIEVEEPQGAFYLFPKVTSFFGKSHGDKTIHSAADMAMYLLEHAHVATVDGGAFCMPGYIRLSYATSEDNLRKAMERIAHALAELH